MIYLDYAANTPVDERVLDTYVNATRKYIANPNSKHVLGKEAKKRIDEASSKIGSYFNTSGKNVIYVSGASEANNLVIKGLAFKEENKGKKIIISALEHSSIVAPCNYLSGLGYDISVIPLDSNGLVDMNVLKEELDDDTILVSITSVDSELGIVQPIEEIAKLVKEYPNCVMHSDATQAIGKVRIDYSNVDFITMTPHKFMGLNGFGVLINFNDIKLIPLIHGGKSTTIYRSGTPVTANVLAMEKALSIVMDEFDDRYSKVVKLNNKLREELGKLSCVHINSPESAFAYTLNFSLVGKDTKMILEELENRGIYVSTTTACALEDAMSKSVFAMTGDERLARNTIRLSMTHLTSMEDIEEFLKVFKELVEL